MKRTIFLITLLALLATAVLGDEAPPPKNNAPVETRLTVVIDQDAKDARIVLSREAFESLTGGQEAPAGLASVARFSRLRTIAGGLLISASVIFAGVWFARRRSRSGVVAAALVAAVGLGSVYVFGNAGPLTFRTIDSRMFSDKMKSERYARGTVKLEVSDEEPGTGVMLVIPLEKKDGEANR